MLAFKTLILTSTYPADLSQPDTNHRSRFRRRLLLVLHVTGLLASLVAIAVFSAAIPRWNANFFHNTGPNRGDWTDGMPLGPLTAAFLYHATVLIHAKVQQARRSSSSITSASSPSLSRRSLLIHTIVPVLILLSLLPSLFLAGYGSLFRFWRPAMRTQSGILVCNMLNVFAKECGPTLYVVGSLQIAGIVFGALVWTLHFALLLVSFRTIRRYVLVKQLQREKIAQYARSERSHSHRSRKASTHGSGEHVIWHQNRHPPRRDGFDFDSNTHSIYRTSSASNSLAAGPEAASGETLGRTDTSPQRQQQQRQQHQEVPIYFVQPPEPSLPLPPNSHRYA